MPDASKAPPGLSDKKKALLAELLRKEGLGSPSASSVEPILPRPEPSDTSPLSCGQERLWLMEQFLEDCPAYNVPSPLHLEGNLNADALEGALRDVLARHEVLRTRFEVVGERPEAIAMDFELELGRHDRSDLEPGTRFAQVLEEVNASFRAPFRLETGPLVRADLWRLADEEHVLLLAFHHAVSDGVTIRVILEELSEAYAARLAGHAHELPAVALQHADFAVWQREWIVRPEIEAELAFWRERLAGPLPALDLPTDRPRLAEQSFQGRWLSRELPQALVAPLEKLAKEHGATLFQVLLAAYEALLYRWTRQEDLLVGIPVATRQRLELERLPGFFVNTLTVRTRVESGLSFLDLVGRVRDAALDAYEHQAVPFERVVEAVQPERDLARTPVFQVMFDHRRGLTKSIPFEGLRSARFLDEDSVHSATAKVDLAFYTEERHEALVAAVEYNTDLFDSTTMERFLGHFEILLTAAINAPDTALRDLPVMSPRERELVVSKWNRTRVDYPEDSTVHEVFSEVAAARPDKVALEFGDEHLTYGELERRSNQLAHHLRALGVEAGCPVALSVDRSNEMIVVLLGILKAGGAYLPLDPSYPRERLTFMLEDSGARHLVTQASLTGTLPTEGLTVVVVDREQDTLRDLPTEAPETAVLATDPAYVIYTSGSSGRPKGVPCPHRGVLRLILGTDWLELDETVRIVHLAPISFDASVLDIWGGLLVGGTVIPFPERVPRLDLLGKVLQDHRVNSLFLTTALFNAVIDEVPEILRGVKQVATGGEAMSPRHIRRQRELLPHLRLCNCYGPTEATVIATRWIVPEVLPEPFVQAPIGRPLQNTTVYVLDADLRPVPLGVVGELYIGGPGVALGYLHRPELTAERFVPDPFGGDPKARLYRTGDMVRWRADGTLVFLGRDDDQVKIRGHRIELGELETRLAEAPGVEQVVVHVREDRPGKKRLVAYLVGASGETLELNAVRQFATRSLPEYMLPAAFVTLDALPMTSGGKIDRRRLPAPNQETSRESGELALPRTATERTLSEMWLDVLGLTRIGVDQDFFALGGHSLMATVLVARMKRTFGVDFPLAALFKNPTIEALAERIDAEEGTCEPLATLPRRREPERPAPLSYNQHGLWFLQRLSPESPFYNVPVTLELYGELDVPALEASLREIVRRHEPLRTTYGLEDGEPVQRVHGAESFVLEHEDQQVEEEMEGVAGVVAAVRAFGSRPFDLETQPPFRALLLSRSSNEHTLALNVHHIAFDGWSMDLFEEELLALYPAFASGKASPLAPLAVSYGDYSAWQREELSGARWDEELAFWKRELEGVAPILELPLDHPRPLRKSWRGKCVRHALDRKLVPLVRAAANERGATVYMTTLTAAQLMLSRYARSKDFVVGTPVAGRTRPELEKSIGLFLNIVALRCDLGGSPDFDTLLERTRTRTLAAHEHQDFPFEALVEELGGERDLSTTPIYQVLFSLRTPRSTSEAGGIIFEAAKEIHTDTSKTDLAITVDDDGENLILDLTYDADLFDVETVRRMACHFENLLAAAIASPNTPVSELEILGPDERVQLLEEWAGPKAQYPRGESVAALFEAQVERTPEAPALVYQGTTLTYRELNEQANQIAHELILLGVEPGSLVTLCLDRTPEMIAATIGILKAGGAYVPLDPSYPNERLSLMFEDTRSPVLIVHSHLRSQLPEFEGRSLVIDEEREVLEAQPTTNPDARAWAVNRAYVMYTSGSTGRPKGVEVIHRAISRLVLGANYADLGPDCTFLQLAPISFDAATFEIWGPLLNGGKLVLYPERVPTAEDLERVLRENGVTTLWLTAALFNAVVDERPKALAGLRQCLTGGEALSVPHIQKAYAALPDSVQLINGYGPTENTTFTTYHPIPRWIGPDAPSIPIGRPITNTTVFIVDERRQPVPIGVPGELLTGGDGLARGYLDQRELTAERFVENPFGEGKLYRTGDLVRWLSDGRIEFLGRNDDQVKIRGHRIELGEIQTLLSDHRAVRKAQVIVREEGKAGKRLVAYVEPNAGQRPESAELAAWLSERMPDYMVPNAFVLLDEMPINANGKVDRGRLPEPGLDSGDRRPKAPESEVERLLATLWERVLGVHDVGAHDDFFELGGHSLLAVKLVREIEDVFGIELPLSALISAPTLYQQGQLLHAGVGSSTSSPLVKIQPQGSRPPIFCVCSLGGTVLNQRPLAMRLGKKQPFYGLQAMDLESRLGRVATIEDYAEHYIKAMKAVQPQGPYFVGGHSFGGVVSYEIAQQLTRAGDEVALCFILDSALPNLDSSLGDRVGSVMAFLRGLPHVPGEAFKQMRRDKAEFRRSVNQKLRFLRRRNAEAPTTSDVTEHEAVDAALLARNAGLRTDDIVDMSQWPENNRRIAERHYHAVLAYEPRPYPGRITLFRSRFQSPFLGLGFQMGWDRVARGGVDVHPVPGGHLTVLQPPHVEVLARRLRNLLRAMRKAA